LTRGGGVVGLSGFVSPKLNPDGSQLPLLDVPRWLGSAVINGVALDATGSVYVTGETDSVDFPTTPGVIQEHRKAALLRGALTRSSRRSRPAGLRSSTRRISMASSTTRATPSQSTAPATRTSWARLCRDSSDRQRVPVEQPAIRRRRRQAERGCHAAPLFVVPGRQSIRQQPSTGSDTGTGIVLDPAGNAYVAGYTLSFDLPTTPDAFNRASAAAFATTSGARAATPSSRRSAREASA
jgi:hypothetical protein